MRLLDTDVKYFDNTSIGVRPLINEWGSITNVLEDCLVLGSEFQKVVSLSTTEDVDFPADYWITTIRLATPHTFLKDLSVIQLEGCLEPSYNQSHRVQDITLDTLKIAFSKADYPIKPVDSFLEENIFVRLAPLGYIKVFDDLNKAVFKSSNEDYKGLYLRVDASCPAGYDPTWTKFARVSAYSDMESIDDFLPKIGRYKIPYYPEDPNRSELPNGSGASGIYGESKWYFSANNQGQGQEIYGSSEQGPFEFNIIGDDKTFYLSIKLVGVIKYWQRVWYCFGKYDQLLPKPIQDNHILCSHERRLRANEYAGWYGDPSGWESGSTFARTNNSSGKYIANDIYQELSNNSHVKVDFISILSRNIISGRDTGFSYNEYYSDLNFVEVYLRAFFPKATKLQGKMRGYYFVGNNVQENIYNVIKNKNIINSKTTDFKFVMLESTSGISSDIRENFISFKLNNWG